MDLEAHVNKKFSNMKCQKVKAVESSVPALEATEIQHLFAEPKPDHDSVDGVLCFGKEDSWKQLEIEDFSYGFEYDLQRKCGGLDCNAQGHDELELGVLDGLLDEVDEVDDIHAANDISGACEDFLLDIELAEKISDLDWAPCGRSQLANSSSDSQSPGFSGSSNGTFGFSESSAATPPESECKNGKIEHLVKCELNDTSEDRWDYQALGGDPVFTTSHDLQNLDVLDDARPLESGISSDEYERKAVQTSKKDTLLGQKRMRRPTKRYIDEFSVPKSKHALETEKALDDDSKDKHVKIRSHNEPFRGRVLTYVPKEESLSESVNHGMLEDEKLSDLKKSKCVTGIRKTYSLVSRDKHMDIGPSNEHHHVRSLKSTPRDESLTGTSTQESFESQGRRGQPKKCTSVSVFEFDDEHSASESEDDHVKKRYKKSGDRRKHQRMWTLSEVTKLIDGIAQYGTGRWTDIKKLSFSSSAYRTPVDLRDKWRNLLRASSVHKQKLKQNKKEVEKKLKHAMRPLPKTVMCRIHELATIHPYPRFTPGGRYVRRKEQLT